MSALALSLVRSLVDTATDALVDIEPAWQGNKVVLPYPVPEHSGEEDCCKGLVIGVIERVYLVEPFPNEVTVQDPCQVSTLAVDAVISAVTCAPRGDRTGKVNFDALTASAEKVWTQAEAVRIAIQCYLTGVEDEDPFFSWGLRGQDPRPQDEGCVGTDLSITFGIQNRCGPCG